MVGCSGDQFTCVEGGQCVEAASVCDTVPDCQVNIRVTQCDQQPACHTVQH